ncbi:hypothetical protein [Algoriphagus sp.]|uniref:hypothetical protein n=1 Tax=Algoriphagus sp. TaxID=1872435 RepID=UPI00391E0126
MIKFIIFFFLILASFTGSKSKLELYSQEIGFDASKATLLISFENCSYCFNEYQETVKEINKKIFNVVIISSQLKKASLFATLNQQSIFVDREKLAIKMELIESLPIILLPNGERIEVFSPNQLSSYAKTYMP